ncbi:hypothetical protein [Nitrospirillum pindoramense]|uniref:Uncharacterized protein n=1 Tax=Nitrospirillum amazonense TaxID=28077 RepID=A0A560GS76_9PROT|nr:hypothetical protein [Nitrospirillum amazonense]TWB36862.1 hypothetical protein FBZ90_11685 [Nitrospirillum amazonense]
MTPSVQSALSPTYPDPVLAGGVGTAASATGQGGTGLAGVPEDFQNQLDQQVAQDSAVKAAGLPGQGAAAVQAQVAAAHKDNHLSFWDVVDVINPLQHIPVISTIYREITGDTIKAPAKILGGLLYGGPIGMALATGDAFIEEETGEDVGGHVMDALGLGHHHKVGTVTLDPDDERGGGKGRQGGQEQPDEAPTAGRAPVAKVESLVLAPQAPDLQANQTAAAPATPAPGQMVRTSSIPADAGPTGAVPTGAVPTGAVPGLATPASTLKSPGLNAAGNAQGQAFPNLAAVPAMAVAAPGANPTQALAQQATQVTNATQALAQSANAAANIGVGTQSMPMGAAPQLMPAQAAAMAKPAAASDAGTHLGQKQAHGLTLANYRAMAGAGAGAPTGRTLVAPSYIQNIKSAAVGPTVLQTGAVQANAAQSQAAQSQAAQSQAAQSQAVQSPATLAAASHPAMIQVMDGGAAQPAQAQRTTPVPQAIQAYNNAMGQDTATLLAQATAASASINGTSTPTGAQPTGVQPTGTQPAISQPAPSGGTLSASAAPPAGVASGQAAPQTGAAIISSASGSPPPLPKQFIADIMMANLAKYQAMKDAQGAAH